MKRFASLFLLLITGCANLSLQNPQPAPVQTIPTVSQTQIPPPSPRGNLPKTSPGFDPVKNVQRDLTYCTPAGVAQKMDLYFPPKADQPAPVVMYVHGGGWTTGDKTQGGVVGFPELASQGFLVAAVNYRLAPQNKFPAMIQDVKCAVRFLRANAATLNLDPNRIGVWGGSAGGHLVALLGTTDASAGFDVGEYADQSSRVQAVVDMFGPSDFSLLFSNATTRTIQSVFGSVTSSQELARIASPVTYATQDDPPFLILQGDKDKVVPMEQSTVLYDRLQSVRVPATLVIVKNAGHGFVPSGGAVSPSRVELVRMIEELFNRYLT